MIRGGWLLRRSRGTSICVSCRTCSEDWLRSARAALREASALLAASPDHGLQVDGVGIDQSAVALLRWLKDCSVKDQGQLPAALQQLLFRWQLSRPSLVGSNAAESVTADGDAVTLSIDPMGPRR